MVVSLSAASFASSYSFSTQCKKKEFFGASRILIICLLDLGHKDPLKPLRAAEISNPSLWLLLITLLFQRAKALPKYEWLKMKRNAHQEKKTASSSKY